MSDQDQTEERPCLHCLIVDLVEDFFSEYPAPGDEDKSGTLDTDEVITALAKTAAELTCNSDPATRQSIIDQLTREIMEYDAEFREQDVMGTAGSGARH